MEKRHLVWDQVAEGLGIPEGACCAVRAHYARSARDFGLKALNERFPIEVGRSHPLPDGRHPEHDRGQVKDDSSILQADSGQVQHDHASSSG